MDYVVQVRSYGQQHYFKRVYNLLCLRVYIWSCELAGSWVDPSSSSDADELADFCDVIVRPDGFWRIRRRESLYCIRHGTPHLVELAILTLWLQFYRLTIEIRRGGTELREKATELFPVAFIGLLELGFGPYASMCFVFRNSLSCGFLSL